MDKSKIAERRDAAKKRIEKSKAGGVIKEFKEFINRGSVVDLAVGVVVGGAFTAIVNSLVNDILMPIVGLIGGGVNFSDLAIDIPNFFGADTKAHIAIGSFLQAVVNFLIVAFVIFLIVRFLNNIQRKAKPQEVSDKKAEKKDDEQIALLKEIRDELKTK